MASVNKVILMGRLGKDPDVRSLKDGSQVVSFSLATSENWKDKNTGEKRDKTEWHRCVAYRKVAEIIGKYVHKGSLIYLEGKLQTKKWQGNDGQDRYTTEIIVNEIKMLDGRDKSKVPTGGRTGYNGPETQKMQYKATGSFKPDAPAEIEFEDDMIPF